MNKTNTFNEPVLLVGVSCVLLNITKLDLLYTNVIRMIKVFYVNTPQIMTCKNLIRNYHLLVKAPNILIKVSNLIRVIKSKIIKKYINSTA